MKLHLVGGFLGSGKTTAIIHSARLLIDQGLQVGVITNDQGKYLVDTAFFRLADLPSVEVTGGCFCCNYASLDDRLNQLIQAANPDVIFAESVGSCADIVATVVKPLLELGGDGVKPTSFSVFADARMLRRRLSGGEMPFSADVVYIFDKQLDEAGLIIANKNDLLSEMARAEVEDLLAKKYPGKPYRLQSSLSQAGVKPWIEQIQTGSLKLPQSALDIDYQRYGAGEARLAWLDAALQLQFPENQGRILLITLFNRLLENLSERSAGIGHLKLILSGQGVRSDGHSVKLSFPTLEEPGWQAQVPEIDGTLIDLLVNARVELPVEELQALLAAVLAQSGCTYRVVSLMALHPAQPNPTHRIV